MPVMKLWIDDVRTPPNDQWCWAKSSEEAIRFLTGWKNWRWSVSEISFDHDLGGTDTTRPVVIWIIDNNYWPRKYSVHSANPVGREWIEKMLHRYSP